MNKNIKQIIILVILIAILIIPYLVFAANPTVDKLESVGSEFGPYTEEVEHEYSIAKIIGLIINTVISLLGVLFVSLIVYAGYNWMTAAGDEAKVTKAKDTIRRAIIGLIIVVSAFAIYNYIFLEFILEGAKDSRS